MAKTETVELKPTRAAFVRSLPEMLPVADVIQRGKEAGIELKPQDVHSTRWYMRQESEKPVLQGSGKTRFALAPDPEPRREVRLRAVTSERSLDPRDLSDQQLRVIILCAGSTRVRAALEWVDRLGE